MPVPMTTNGSKRLAKERPVLGRPLKSLSPSRLEIKGCKFNPPTVSDGERWSRRSTEQGRISRDGGKVKR